MQTQREGEGKRMSDNDFLNVGDNNSDNDDPVKESEELTIDISSFCDFISLPGPSTSDKDDAIHTNTSGSSTRIISYSNQSEIGVLGKSKGQKSEKNTDFTNPDLSSTPGSSSSNSSSMTMISTSVNPSIVKLCGSYGFSVEVNIDKKKRSIDFSELLNKLFVDMNKWVKLTFRLSKPPNQDLFVRALPVYTEGTDFKNPVIRCPHHSRKEDSTNIHFQFPNHFLRDWLHSVFSKLNSLFSFLFQIDCMQL